MAYQANWITTRAKVRYSSSPKCPLSAKRTLQRTMRLASSCPRQPGVSSLIQRSVILPSTVWVILQKELGHRTFVLRSVSYMTFTFMPQRHCQVTTRSEERRVGKECRYRSVTYER